MLISVWSSDVCSSVLGDITFRAYDAGCGRVTVCALTERMVRVGRDRAIDRGVVAGVDWLVGDAEALPVAAASVDAYTVAFGMRNVARLDAALAEARSVLRQGGRFLCIDLSRVDLSTLG